jgi:hypothetical protein
MLVHMAIIGALVISGRELAGRGQGGSRAPGAGDARLNFFTIPATGPAAVDVALPPRVTLSDLSALRRIQVDLPRVELLQATLPPPPPPLGGGGGNAGVGGAGRAPGLGAAAGAGVGSGTGDEAGYIFPASPRTAILPPLAKVPGSVAGRTYHVKFWVSVDGRVTRVEVAPPIADAEYGREFRRRMMAYQFYPAHFRDGRNVAYVVTVPLRIGH